jgi:hypothetical protein
MLKHSLIALAALGLSWCQKAAERRAARRDRWRAFWSGKKK